MSCRPIETAAAPVAIGPYSQAVEAAGSGLLFLSGQIPLDPATGELVGGSIADQTHRVMRNLTAVLEGAGLGWKNVAKTTIYLADLNDFVAVNEVYSSYLGGHRPARATVQVAALPKGVPVEIEAVAVSTRNRA